MLLHNTGQNHRTSAVVLITTAVRQSSMSREQLQFHFGPHAHFKH